MQERLEAAQAQEQAGRVVDAEKEYRAINETLKGHPALYNLLAQNLVKQRRYREAVDAFKNGLEIASEPNDIEHLLFHAALTCYDHLNIREGIALLEEHLAQPFGNSSTVQLLVQGYSLLGEVDQCLDILKQMQAQNPQDFWPVDTACQILATHNRHDEAITLLKGSDLDQNSSPILNLLHKLHLKKGEPKQALPHLEQALQQSPEDPDVRIRLLWLYWALGQEDSAAEIATSLSPDTSDLRFSLSNYHLATGNMEKGLPDYDYLYATAQHREKQRLIPLPGVFSVSQLVGKRVLLTSDQGIGDQTRFARHFRDLDASRYKKLWIACDPRLFELFQTSFPHLKFIGEDQLSAEWAQRAGFDIELKHPSAANMAQRQAFEPLPGYLKASDEIWEEKIEQLREGGKPLIGLCWRSVIDNPERRHWYYPLSGYAKALKDANATVISLQNDVSDEERALFEEYAGFPLTELPDFDPKDDLSALACICRQLDLVVSAGTATAELSGATGAPTLLVSRRFPDRWYLSEAYLKQYYPNMTPLVLNTHQDWGELDSKLHQTLNKLLAEHG